MENLILLFLQNVVTPVSEHLATESSQVIEQTIVDADAEEILWLARVIHSETKDADEMYDIAWVVRNRVETNFRGDTYEKVAKSKNQFSGLQPSDVHYRYNISRTYESTGEAWKNSVEVAKEVYNAPSSKRPFPITVRHFYSPVAVDAPMWADHGELHSEVIDPKGNVRFAFYDGVK